MKKTIKDIAEMTGVSPGTVSKVINNYSDVGESTRRKVQEALKKVGYRTKLHTKKNIIGVIYGGKVEFNHPFFVDVINMFSKEIGFLGYDLLFISRLVDNKDYLQRCKEAQVDGCIIVGGEESEQSLQELDRSDIPCIGIDIKLKGDSSSYIMTDNINLGKKVIEHFYLLGHREIAYIGGRKSAMVGSERTLGFHRAMTEFGLDAHEKWIEHGDFSEKSGYQAMKKILFQSDNIPRALFVASDLMAFGAMAAIKQHGLKIPSDIAVVGCDDIEISRYIEQPLSTMKQDKDKIGRLAAYMLIDQINGFKGTSSVIVDSELVIRNTCG
ncbi:LacI family DNA-binding transcriptional regulator [Aquibacillus halophilus]|uniref:LacI family DNA-binding transcriptional regulator n=1 Tax=Aquibacillus halophilus TaxID=930132 RepID=A0A6A8DSZ6_9BACI|nr:LacI family DNA-binding transcriptional regulator [Aquibacillus halophilus]MRH44332.1 LacI family DNA-binding transcriptional regulator [Aquibacillus halophilus]